ncbi:hypothetical protein E9840_12000 [Tissierella creatinini]|nr:hypothetical protein E9840_12000 [Tissierella creatinini]TJX60075.1 hypothetical protein E8P77_20625 [Soehngenia saccharolytica]
MNLKLFCMEGCPYCMKVIRYIEKNNIPVELADIGKDPKNQEDLMKIGGLDQVPMLLIDGKPLYESSDIIQWLKENK